MPGSTRGSQAAVLTCRQREQTTVVPGCSGEQLMGNAILNEFQENPSRSISLPCLPPLPRPFPGSGQTSPFPRLSDLLSASP